MANVEFLQECLGISISTCGFTKQPRDFQEARRDISNRKTKLDQVFVRMDVQISVVSLSGSSNR